MFKRGVGGRGRRRGGGRAPPPGQAAARPRGGAPREEAAAGAEERGRRAAREAEPDHLAGRGSEHRAGDLESSGVMHGNERYTLIWLDGCCLATAFSSSYLYLVRWLEFDGRVASRRVASCASSGRGGIEAKTHNASKIRWRFRS